jgi:putative transposase
MPRAARLVLPGHPHHVTQRGNRRQPTFFSDSDYGLYLGLLRYWCRKSGTSVWAWCLMPNHVHLVLVPAEVDGLRATLAPAHRLYTAAVNHREGWRGHLWQGRFASFPMDEAHLHACLRYVELNPVRAGLVERPEQWRWSSACAHLGLRDDRLTDSAAAEQRIGDWRAFLDAGLDEAEGEAIRLAERTGRLML